MRQEQGLYGKYRVFNSETGEELKSFFVLKPDADPSALAALQTYAELTPNKDLKSDLSTWIKDIQTEEVEVNGNRMA